MNTNIYSMLLTSEVSFELKGEDLARELTTKIQLSPAEASLTGVLFFDGQRFVQFLEGQLDELEAVYDSISSDLRHVRLRVLEFSAKEERRFDRNAVVFCANAFPDELAGVDFDALIATGVCQPLVTSLTSAVSALNATVNPTADQDAAAKPAALAS